MCATVQALLLVWFGLFLSSVASFNLPMPKRRRRGGSSSLPFSNPASKKTKPVVTKTSVPVDDHDESSTKLNLKPTKPPASSSSLSLSSSSSSSGTELAAATMFATVETPTSKMSSLPTTTTTMKKAIKTFKVYCDMDGVLVDFDAGVRELSDGVAANDLPKKRMWKLIDRSKNFYEELAWMPDGEELWEAIRHTQPDILTGVPTNREARTGKFRWCRRELGVDVNHVDMAGAAGMHRRAGGRRKKGVTNVITCWSRNKHFESGQRAVLIDDREDLGIDWKQKGGIFIHHTSTASTLQQLRAHGIIPDINDDDDAKQSSSPGGSLCGSH